MQPLMKTKSNMVDDRDWLRYRRLHLDDLPILEPPRPKSAPPSSEPSVHMGRGNDTVVSDDEELSEQGNYTFELDDYARCHGPGNFICGRCQGAPSSALLSGVLTSYCSQECQEKHYHDHEPSCSILSQRKSLLKTAVVLHEIWLKIRASCYPFNITRVAKEDDRLAVHEGDEARNMDGRVFFTAADLGALKARNGLIREQVLFMGSSRTAIALLHEIAKELLQDLGCEYVQEITVPYKDPVIHYDVNGVRSENTKPIAHVVFETRFRDREAWVIDITTAAIGLNYLICPWQEWRDMTESGYDEHPLGHQAEVLNTIRGDKNLAFIYTNLQYLTLKMIPNALKYRLDSDGIFLRAIHKISDENFPQVKANVMRHLDLAIEEWAAFMALPQVMDDIGAIFKEISVSTMVDQAVREELREIKDRGMENRVGVEHEIMRVFQDEKECTRQDRVVQGVMRDILFG